MKRVLIILGVVTLLASCKTAEQQRAIDMANDNKQCQAQGFAPGSQALAECMDTAAQSRAADQTRQAAAQQAWFDRNDANFRNWQQKVDNSDNWSPPTRNQNIDTRPQFDKQGNPNFDAQGNYQGCHSIGCQVDIPDSTN
ncbi:MULTISPECIES: hypothetical protein [Rhizobium]|uniref:Lipoprotein n=1 Tax=Rhizobium tropici TaxID=398 RepID=A0A6P1CFM6_RHITR|nr:MULTISPECIES: hypothetical protein [Rhizobium]MBB4242097.1 hypothetical protein [Rhizobium tropici]MBB5593878.1 hypothetical protein [Rhizobium tropici]MBB6492422.1 hypothetical protein [Rhizobium tropici]NEV15156.1 hypothetical protein [Rhizobium tropici]